MKGELHPAKIVWPEAYLLSCIWMTAYNELLYFLVSPLPDTATAYTLPHGCLTSETLRSMIIPFARN